MPKDKKAKHKEKAGHRAYEQNGAAEVVIVAVEEHEDETEQDEATVVEADTPEEGLPPIFVPQAEGDYSAAFGDELLDPAFIQQAFLAQLAPGALLPHSGRARLSEEGLDFEGLAYIPFDSMLSVQVHVDRVYHRYYAGLAALGGRGGQSHILTGGEPFVITFRDGDQTRSLYAVLEWPFFLALSKEKGWRKAVGGVLPAKEKKK